MTSKPNILAEINSLETDYRAEVIVAGLRNAGQKEGKALIVRQSTESKELAKDISKINTVYSGVDLIAYLYIYTNRYGIYDSLPEGLFHQASFKGRRSQESVIGEIREDRQKEFYARQFFQPFEIAVDQLLIDAQTYEQRFDKAYLYDNVKNIFEEHWDILKYLSIRQGMVFLRCIPIIPESSRSFDLMASIMSVILDCPVKINESHRSYLHMAEEEKVGLGNNMKLGINSVMGTSVKTDNRDLDVIIGPTSAQQVRDFQASKNNQIILEKLMDMIIPFDRNTNIKYEVHKTERKFRLSDENHKSYLGVNTVL